MSTSVLKALPGKLDIKRHSPSILYLYIEGSRVILSKIYFISLSEHWALHGKLAVNIQQVVKYTSV